MKIFPISGTNEINKQINLNNKIKQNNQTSKNYNKISTNNINFTGLMNFNPRFEYNYSLNELKDMLSPEKYTAYKLLDTESNVYQDLPDGDKKALIHLVKAANFFDNVYKRLDNEHNLDFEKFLIRSAALGDPQAILTKKLYDGQKGIIGRNANGENVILAKNIKVLPGKGFFPEDLSEEEFHKILIRMIKENKVEEVKKILNQRSIVLRNNDELKAIDYTEFFKEEFFKAANELELAAKYSTNNNFNEYLILQAKALREDNPLLDCAADKKWAALQNTPLEFTIGRECYSDKMTATVFKNQELKKLIDKHNIPVYAKDNLGVRVGIVDPEGTSYLLQIKKFLPLMAKKMPFKNNYKQKITNENIKQSMVDAHIVQMTGGNGAFRGAISIASNLPNSDKLAVQTGGGFRNVYNKEIRQAKYANNMDKKIHTFLDESQHKYFKVDALHDFTILHENMHSLGPKEGLERLGTYKNTIEELKADMGGLVMLDELKKNNFYDEKKQKEIITSWIVAYIPKGPDFSNAHIIRNIMQYNYFIQNGGIKIDKSGKIKIDFDKINKCARKMLEDAIRIQLSKNEEKAQNYINKYTIWTDELNLLASNLKKIDKRLNSYLDAPLARKLTQT